MNPPKTDSEYQQQAERTAQRAQKECRADHGDMAHARIAEYILRTIPLGSLLRAKDENDALKAELAKLKARNLVFAIGGTCEACGHTKTEDGCAFCMTAELASLKRIAKAARNFTRDDGSLTVGNWAKQKSAVVYALSDHTNAKYKLE